MQNTQPPDPQIIANFKQRSKRQLIATIPLFLIAIATFMIDNVESNDPMGISSSTMYSIFGAMMIGIFIFSFFNWRCPSCNSYLGKKIGMKFCQKCGAQLKE